MIERRDWMDEIAESLRGYEVFFVKVSCPLEELERREKTRGDRQVGFAKMQLEWVHRHGDYDDEVNTFTRTTEQNVERLKQLIYSDRKPVALERYRKDMEARQEDAANR